MGCPRFSLGKVITSAGALRERKALRVQESRHKPHTPPKATEEEAWEPEVAEDRDPGERKCVRGQITEGEKERTVKEQRWGRKRRVGGAREDGAGSGGRVRIQSRCSAQQRGGERSCLVAPGRDTGKRDPQDREGGATRRKERRDPEGSARVSGAGDRELEAERRWKDLEGRGRRAEEPEQVPPERKVENETP